MNTPNKTIKILMVVAVIIAGSVLWFFYDARDINRVAENPDHPSSFLKEEKSKKINSVANSVLANMTDSIQIQKYKNAKYGFSFDYPNDFKINEFEEEGEKFVLTAQNGKTGQSLQIHITTYDDPSFVVSKERILKDVPDTPFFNSADIIVADKAKGVAFFSRNEVFGETAEAWFADKKNFYQITAYKEDAEVLEEIIKSWKFQ